MIEPDLLMEGAFAEFPGGDWDWGGGVVLRDLFTFSPNWRNPSRKLTVNGS